MLRGPWFFRCYGSVRVDPSQAGSRATIIVNVEHISMKKLLNYAIRSRSQPMRSRLEKLTAKSEALNHEEAAVQ